MSAGVERRCAGALVCGSAVNGTNGQDGVGAAAESVSIRFAVLESVSIGVAAAVGDDSVVGAVAVAIVGGVGVFLVYESSC